MDKLWRRQESGYSLVELLIALSLIGLVLSLAWGIYPFGVTMYSRGNDQSTLQQEERYLFEFLSRELMYAFGVEILGSLDEVPEPAAGEALLYSNEQGIWRKMDDQATLVLPASRASFELAFRGDASSKELLLFDYTVSLVKNPAITHEVVKTLYLFNSKLKGGTGTVLRYEKSS